MGKVEMGVPTEFLQKLSMLMPGETAILTTEDGRRFVFLEEEEFRILCERAQVDLVKPPEESDGS